MIEWTDEALEQVINRIESRKSPVVFNRKISGESQSFTCKRIIKPQIIIGQINILNVIFLFSK